MAWTEITYACGHGDRIQMYGPDRQRQARVFGYRQKPCAECRRAQWQADRPEYVRPRFELQRAGGGGARILVHRTYDCWRELANRGYQLVPYHGPGVEWDAIEPARMLAEPEQRKAYQREFDSPEALTAELAWLEAIEAECIEAPRAAAHSLPRAFASFEEEWGPAFSEKVANACHTIRLALRRARQPYVAFSGGKDSTATLALVHAVAPRVRVIWSDDELEFPESIALMERTAARLGDRFLVTLGWAEHANWFRPWRDSPGWREPFPGALPIGRDMAEWAQTQGYDLTFLGLRGDESKVRGALLSEVGPIYRRRFGLVCCPLWDWDDESVWRLIRSTGADYNAAYDRYRELGLPPELQRVGPLPLSPRDTLARGWPELLARLEARYGPRWS